MLHNPLKRCLAVRVYCPPKALVAVIPPAQGFAGKHTDKMVAAWTMALFCMLLSTVTGWLCSAVPVSQLARLHRVRHEPTILRRHSAVAPQMCSDDSLSAELEARSLDIAAQPKIMFGSPLDTLRQHKAEGAYVLIFNRGQDDEGVYTVRGSDASCAGMHVLAFENRAEASRYAVLLQEQDFDKLTATRWESEPLADFCWRAEFGLGYVPPDAMLVPPQRNHVDAAAIEQRQEDAFAKQQKSAGGARHWSEQEAEASSSMWSGAGGSAVRTRTDKLTFDI